jgi:hypothetical protein
MKHLVTIEAATTPLAYRIPIGLLPVIDRFLTQETPANAPITEMVGQAGDGVIIGGRFQA